MSESPSNSEERGYRMMALMCASVAWKGRGEPDFEQLEALADEFFDYIVEDVGVGPVADMLLKGYLPKGKAK